MEPSASLAIMTYNMLVGGDNGRLPAIEAVIRAVGPDVVGIQEANDPAAIRWLADRLGMEYRIGYAANGYHVALLSRFPIQVFASYGRPVFQKGLIAAQLDVPGEPAPWQVFVGHLTAEFFRWRRAERHRAAEVRAMLACMAGARAAGHPHVLLGDFNALAPGEPFDGALLVARVVALDNERERQRRALRGQPHLGYIVPPLFRPLMPLLRRVPRSRITADLVRAGGTAFVPRLAVPELLRAGYVDALRAALGDPAAVPPTCPLPTPAGRIDYIWMDPVAAATRLIDCVVVADAPGCPVLTASDHAPVVARFVRVAAAPVAAPPQAALALAE